MVSNLRTLNSVSEHFQSHGLSIGSKDKPNLGALLRNIKASKYGLFSLFSRHFEGDLSCFQGIFSANCFKALFKGGVDTSNP